MNRNACPVRKTYSNTSKRKKPFLSIYNQLHLLSRANEYEQAHLFFKQSQRPFSLLLKLKLQHTDLKDRRNKLFNCIKIALHMFLI